MTFSYQQTFLDLQKQSNVTTNQFCTKHAQGRMANCNNAMQELGLHNRGELIKYAIQKKILEI